MCYFDGHIKKLNPVPNDLITPIKELLTAQNHLWASMDGNKPNKFSCFEGSVQHLVFQYPVSRSDHTKSTYYDLWNSWSNVIQPVIEHAVESYNYKSGRTSRIMMARLIARTQIKKHVDAASSAKIPHKIHVPIITNQEVFFIAQRKQYHLAKGYIWEVNNRIPHGGINQSRQDRIHLIFDYYNL